MFKHITRRMSVGLAAALVVGSLALVDAGTARAQATGPNQAATQTAAPGMYGQPGSYGNGYGSPCPWMTGAGYVQAGQPGYRQAAPGYANAPGRYYGNRYPGRSYGYPCW